MKDKKRPPRVYIDAKGKRYIKLKGKKVYIKSKIDNKNLVRVVINNFQKKIKRSKKRKNKPTKEEDKIKKEQDKTTSQSSLDLAKILFHSSANQKDKEDRERRNQQLITPAALPGIPLQPVAALQAPQQPPALQAQQQPPALQAQQQPPALQAPQQPPALQAQPAGLLQVPQQAVALNPVQRQQMQSITHNYSSPPLPPLSTLPKESQKHTTNTSKQQKINLDPDKTRKMSITTKKGKKIKIYYDKDDEPDVDELHLDYSKTSNDSNLYKQTKEKEKENEILTGINKRKTRGKLVSIGNRLGIESRETLPIYNYLIEKGKTTKEKLYSKLGNIDKDGEHPKLYDYLSKLLNKIETGDNRPDSPLGSQPLGVSQSTDASKSVGQQQNVSFSAPPTGSLASPKLDVSYSPSELETPEKRTIEEIEEGMEEGRKSVERGEQNIRKYYYNNPPGSAPQLSFSSPQYYASSETPPPPTPKTPLPADINDYSASNPQSFGTNLDANTNSKASLVQRRLELQEKEKVEGLSDLENAELGRISAGEQHLRSQQTVHIPASSLYEEADEEIDEGSDAIGKQILDGLIGRQQNLKLNIISNEEILKTNPNNKTAENLIEDYKKQLQQVEKEIRDFQFNIGSGKKEGGLYDDQIENVMEKYKQKGFKGVYAIDEIDKIPVSNKMGVILNLDKSNQPGSHWTALYIDADNDKSVEYYDSFADDPPESLMKDLKNLVDKINPSVYLKFKINKIKQQSAKSDNCGVFAMKFLIDRFNGKPFKFCTGFSDIVNSEKKAQRFRKKLERFGFI